MSTNMENGNNTEVSEIPPEATPEVESPAETEETAENFEDCSLVEVPGGKDREEKTDASVENYDDCGVCDEKTGEGIIGASEADDFEDCERKIEAKLAEVAKDEGVTEVTKVAIDGAFDRLPEERREAVYESFDNAPDEVKEIVKELSEELVVEDTENDDCCHYDLLEKKIRMESDMDDAEYAEVFSHEYGHFVDDKLGGVSDTYEFRSAMAEDLAQYDRTTESGRRSFDEMMSELMETDAAYDRAVSDCMSAYFRNDPEIVQRYWDEGVDYYSHRNEYWDRSGNREAEIYANAFSMMAQDNEASCEFMKKYFPKTWEQFRKTL